MSFLHFSFCCSTHVVGGTKSFAAAAVSVSRFFSEYSVHTGLWLTVAQSNDKMWYAPTGFVLSDHLRSFTTIMSRLGKMLEAKTNINRNNHIASSHSQKLPYVLPFCKLSRSTCRH